MKAYLIKQDDYILRAMFDEDKAKEIISQLRKEERDRRYKFESSLNMCIKCHANDYENCNDCQNADIYHNADGKYCINKTKDDYGIHNTYYSMVEIDIE